MTNIARKIYENQLRIEAEQRETFQKRPLIEPPISSKVRAKFLSTNPFYKVENVDVMNEVQLAKFVSQAGITMPVGMSPYSVEGQAHIKTQIRLLADVSGIQMTTIPDLLKVLEDPDKKMLQVMEDIRGKQTDTLEVIRDSDNLLQFISGEVYDSKTSLEKMLNDKKLEKLERDLWGDEEEEEKVKLKRVYPQAVRIEAISDRNMNEMNVLQLRSYIKDVLGYKRHSKDTRQEAIAFIRTKQSEMLSGN